jgi:FlaA1/EpsC-like NDP-sugar epimerase
MKLYRRLRGNRLLLADLILIGGSVIASFALRLNVEQFFLDYLPAMFTMALVALIIKPLIYRRLGLYRRVWAYASVDEMKLIIRAVTLASAAVALIMLLAFYGGLFRGFPRSVLVIDWLISLAAVGALRFSFRLLAESGSQADRGVPLGSTRAVLIVGAGSAGSLVVRELQKNARLGLTPLAFLDDDPDKLGHQIHGVPVAGTLADLPQQVHQRHADEVIVAIPSASGSVLRTVADLCQQANVPFRTMPGIYELLGGTVSISRLREVDITDLLRRQPARLDRKPALVVPLPVNSAARLPGGGRPNLYWLDTARTASLKSSSNWTWISPN